MYSPTERRDNQHIFSELDDLERHALVTDITRIAPHMNNVSRNGFWELWLADISKLKYYKDYALRYESADKSRRMDIIFRSEHGDDSLGLTSPILLDKRLQSIRPVSSNEQAAINRDKSQCVLTNSRATTVHPTHMVPTYLHEVTEESKNYQWYIYEDLFGRERVQRWRDAIMTSMICRDTGNTGRIHNTDRPENMISLDKQARRYWQDDMCAFRPVSLSEDKTSMELAFHWIPLPVHGTCHYHGDRIKLRRHPYPHKRLGCDDTPGCGIRLYDAETKQAIYSGQIFTMKTEDPIAHPLPSWDLLDMQWMLKRFSRFQGDSKSTYRGWVRRGMKPTDDYDWVHRGSTWNWRRRAWVWDEDDAEMHKDDSEESEESEVSGWMSSEYDTDDDDGDS